MNFRFFFSKFWHSSIPSLIFVFWCNRSLKIASLYFCSRFFVANLFLVASFVISHVCQIEVHSSVAYYSWFHFLLHCFEFIMETCNFNFPFASPRSYLMPEPFNIDFLFEEFVVCSCFRSTIWSQICHKFFMFISCFDVINWILPSFTPNIFSQWCCPCCSVTFLHIEKCIGDDKVSFHACLSSLCPNLFIIPLPNSLCFFNVLFSRFCFWIDIFSKYNEISLWCF